jgi:hypothetical protein
MLGALLSIILGDRDQGKLPETHDIETRKAFRELFLRTLCPDVCQPIVEDRFASHKRRFSRTRFLLFVTMQRSPAYAVQLCLIARLKGLQYLHLQVLSGRFFPYSEVTPNLTILPGDSIRSRFAIVTPHCNFTLPAPSQDWRTWYNCTEFQR